MKNYIVTGYGIYASYEEKTINAKNPLEALKEFLLINKINYVDIEKLTNAKNKYYMDTLGLGPLELASLIEFTVSLENSYSPSSTGNYKLIK